MNSRSWMPAPRTSRNFVRQKEGKVQRTDVQIMDSRVKVKGSLLPESIERHQVRGKIVTFQPFPLRGRRLIIVFWARLLASAMPRENHKFLLQPRIGSSNSIQNVPGKPAGSPRSRRGPPADLLERFRGGGAQERMHLQSSLDLTMYVGLDNADITRSAGGYKLPAVSTKPSNYDPLIVSRQQAFRKCDQMRENILLGYKHRLKV